MQILISAALLLSLAWPHCAQTPAPATVQTAPPPQAMPARLATDPDSLTTPTLVSTAWVERRADQIVLLDGRDSAEAFGAGHLPRAQHVPIARIRAEREGVPDQLLDQVALAEFFGNLGLTPNSEVVLYGDDKLQDPAHLALALLSLGHARLAILEGGLGAWKAEGRVVSNASVTLAAQAYSSDVPSLLKSADLARVRAASEQKKNAKLLDVRPADAFRGETRGDPRPGHIPGSQNRPIGSDLQKTDNGLYWRPIDELRSEYIGLGLAPDQPVIVSCRSGHTAAQTYFTLRYVLGYEDVAWYDGSFKEWSARNELPVETGAPQVPEPKAKPESSSKQPK